jgi:hypothetical protein
MMCEGHRSYNCLCLSSIVMLMLMLQQVYLHHEVTNLQVKRHYAKDDKIVR